VPSLVWNFLAKPKSIINMMLDYFYLPIKKLSGLISLCRNPW
jgi:hypothetical protein